MTPHRRSMYHLAEHLHMPVTRLLKEMTVSEYVGWLGFFDERNKKSGSRGRDIEDTDYVSVEDSDDADILNAFGRLM